MSKHLVEPSADRTAGLEAENQRLRAENERLRGMLGLPPGVVIEAEIEPPRLFPEDDPLPRVDGRSPAQEKIGLFRALFRGREDVYARYWCDDRSGKKGYSPAARGGSGRGTKDYLPLTDKVLYRHLAGIACRGPLQPPSSQGREPPPRRGPQAFGLQANKGGVSSSLTSPRTKLTKT